MHNIIARSLSKVKSEWFGMQLSMDQIGDMYEMRGTVTRTCSLALHELTYRKGSNRVALLQLMTSITYSPLCKNSDLISLLRIAYLSTTRNTPLASDNFTPPVENMTLFDQKSCEWHEGIVHTFRMPLEIPRVPNDKDDAPLQVPAAAVGAPYLLLRILTVLAERGVLQEIQQWQTLPSDCAVGTDLRQVKQITSLSVIKKLLPIVAKRVTRHREGTRMIVADRFFYQARSRYRQAAELAAAMIAFDKVTNGQWSEDVRGMWIELVLCLGNAAEMSNRHAEHKTALGYAVAASEVAKAAPANAGISADTIAKNERRAETARSNVSGSLLDTGIILTYSNS